MSVEPVTGAEIAAATAGAPPDVARMFDADALAEVRVAAAGGMAHLPPNHQCATVEDGYMTAIVTGLLAGIVIGQRRASDAIMDATAAVEGARQALELGLDLLPRETLLELCRDVSRYFAGAHVNAGVVTGEFRRRIEAL